MRTIKPTRKGRPFIMRFSGIGQLKSSSVEIPMVSLVFALTASSLCSRAEEVYRTRVGDSKLEIPKNPGLFIPQF